MIQSSPNEQLKYFEKYGVHQSIVLETMRNPDKVQKLLNSSRLYLKNFTNPDERRKFLLIGMQSRGVEESLVFAYWIPQELVVHEVELLGLLSLFANQFGVKIRIGSVEGYFIQHAERITQNNQVDPFSLVDVIANGNLPVDITASIASMPFGTLNRFHFYYSFGINTGKYIFWVDSYPITKLRIVSGWAAYVRSNLIDYLQPDEQSKIEIEKQVSNQHLLEDQSKSLSEIEVPEIYASPLRYIFEQINNLKDKEWIFFKISLESPRCIFCNSQETSKEHIFPVWLRKYTTEQMFEPVGIYSDEDKQIKGEDATSIKAKGSSYGYTAKLACSTCNSGWMSQLDKKAKSILVKNEMLVKSLDNISKLNAIDLAKWLIMKSLVLSNKLHYMHYRIERNVYDEIRNGVINDGFLVEVTEARNKKISYAIGKGTQHDNALRLKKIKLNIAKKLTSNFFVCCLQIENILFRISFLEKELPFTRCSTVFITKKIYPYLQELKHIEHKNSKTISDHAMDKDCEVDMLCSTLLLEEKIPLS